MIRIRTNRDREHLRLLVMFHYILAALDVVTGCSPIFHVAMGIAMITGAFDAGPNPPPPALGWLFTMVGATIAILFWTMAILQLLAARWLGNRTHYHLCFAIACLECVKVPQGTLLGVFTILVLLRPSVKAIFMGTPLPESDADDWPEEAESLADKETL